MERVAVVAAEQVCRIAFGTGVSSGHQYDLAVGVAFLELLIGVADIVEIVDAGDGDLEPAFVDEIGKFGEYAGFGALRIAMGLDVVFMSGFEVDDGVYPLGFDA